MTNHYEVDNANDRPASANMDAPRGVWQELTINVWFDPEYPDENREPKDWDWGYLVDAEVVILEAKPVEYL